MRLKGRERTMKKGIALIAMMIAAILMLSGCNLIGYDEALDGAQVVAKVNDTEITKAEWLAYRDYLASYYQQYYQQYFGVSMPLTDEDVAAYGESALEQMIESTVIGEKIKEMGFDPLGEEDAAEVEEYADSMYDFYKMLVRYQNYADVETIEEEQERLALATPDEAEPAEAVATVTNAELDEMLARDMEAIGYTREYFVQSKTSSVQQELLRDQVVADIAVSDEEVKTEFDKRVSEQKESFDETPTLYAQYMNNGTQCYYVPAGYRGVKNLLVGISSEKSSELSTLRSSLSTAQSAQSDAQKQLDEMNAQDVSDFDEEALGVRADQIAALEEQLASANATVADTQTQIEEVTAAAFAEIEETANEALARAKAGEDFDALIEELGTDTGMKSEPNKSRGYLVCEGLSLYEQDFQDAAMALGAVGDISELVKTSYGYHILQYATDVEAGEVELSDELKTSIHDEMLSEAQDAAYDAAVTQWVSEADVKTFPKVME